MTEHQEKELVWYQQACQKLETIVSEYTDLKEADDETPTAEMIQAAKEFLRSIADLSPKLSLPIVSISPNGNIYFRWENAGGHLDVVVTDENMLAYNSSPRSESELVEMKKLRDRLRALVAA